MEADGMNYNLRFWFAKLNSWEPILDKYKCYQLRFWTNISWNFIDILEVSIANIYFLEITFPNELFFMWKTVMLSFKMIFSEKKKSQKPEVEFRVYFFAKVNFTPLFVVISMLNGVCLLYFFNNRGVMLILSAGISLILSFSRISWPWRKLNSSYADWLFSFFLVYELIWLIIRSMSFCFNASKDVPCGKIRRIISWVTSQLPFWSERWGSQ